jgi:hypothetical protein
MYRNRYANPDEDYSSQNNRSSKVSLDYNRTGSDRVDVDQVSVEAINYIKPVESSEARRLDDLDESKEANGTPLYLSAVRQTNG